MWCLYNYNDQQAKIGITNFAQRTIGDIKKLELPSVGQKFEKNETVGKLESNKSVFSIYSPVKGKVTQINGKIFEDPTYVNQNAENFWIVEYSLKDEGEMKELMKDDEYYAYVEQLQKAADEKAKGENLDNA